MKRTLHCWEDGPRVDRGARDEADPYDDGTVSTTCLLARDHAGPHDWTPDDKVIIGFPASRSVVTAPRGACPPEAP